MWVWVVRIDRRVVAVKLTKEEASLIYIKYKMLHSDKRNVTLTMESIP